MTRTGKTIAGRRTIYSNVCKRSKVWVTMTPDELFEEVKIFYPAATPESPMLTTPLECLRMLMLHTLEDMIGDK